MYCLSEKNYIRPKIILRINAGDTDLKLYLKRLQMQFIVFHDVIMQVAYYYHDFLSAPEFTFAQPMTEQFVIL